MQTLLQDLRFGFRMLRRSPGFTVLALLCLTLGIGSNAAVFSWIEGILIRPYPLVSHQDRMFALVGTTRGRSEEHTSELQSHSDLVCRLLLEKKNIQKVEKRQMAAQPHLSDL